MRLLVCDADPSDVQSALSHLKVAEGISVKMNPQWLNPDPDVKLWVACGAPAVKMVQAAGWIPKKGGVEALRGKLWQNIQPDGWGHSFSLGVSYAPQIRHIEVADFVKFETDIGVYRRFEKTGTMDAVLGDYKYVHDLSGVIRYMQAKHEMTGLPVELSLDTETEGLDPYNPEKRIVCLQATAKPGLTDVCYTLTEHFNYQKVAGPNKGVWSWTDRLETIVSQLEWIAAQPWIRIIGANFKYDLGWIRQKWGVDLAPRFAFDTCNGGSLVDENRPNTLELHTKIYSPDLGGYDSLFNQTHDKSKMGEVPPQDLLPYAGGDTDACLRNYYQIREELLSDNLTKSGRPSKNSLASVYLNVVHPTLRALHKMERTGVCVDTDKFHAFGADLENRMKEATKKAASHLPKWVLDKHGGMDDEGAAPLSKPKMIADFLFSPQGLNLQPKQTTEKTGAPSTSQYHLEQFKDHPEAGPLLEWYLDYKSTSKMHGTYYKGFLNHLRADDRWHASYIIHKQGGGKNNEQDAKGTVTGRGSATAPAFQCVTGDTEVLTKDGVRTAASLIDPIIPDDGQSCYVEHAIPIWGRSGWETTGYVFKSWRSDLIRFRLKCGNEITCTPEHPLLVTRHGGKYTKKQGGIWVQAKDILPLDQIAIPAPVERPDGPDGFPDDAFEALGVIAAAGYLTATGDVFYIELPPDHSSIVLTALHQMGVAAECSSVVDDGVTKHVVQFKVKEGLSPQAVQWVLWLPHPSQPIIPHEVRGTKKWYLVLRGIITSVGTPMQGPGAFKGVRLKVNVRSLALAIIREHLMDGVRAPVLRRMKGKHVLELLAHRATHALTVAGLPTLGVDYDPPRYPEVQNYGMEVRRIDSVGAGWVYDFTMPDTSAFLANGMISHNTVPKHSYWGKRLRECIIAPPGHVIVARDYSQGELKVAACWAGEETMIKAYKAGVDLHVLTAATVNSMSYEEALNLKTVDEAAYKELRQNGKAGNFGLIYGMSAFGFMMYADAVYGVKLTIEEAEAMRDAYFDLYSGLPYWHDRQITEARVNGMVRSPLGRLRHLPNIASPIASVRKTTENQAINSPIQGTLVDMLWMSMGIIEEKRPELLMPCAQVHDQGIWYTPEDMADEALAYTGEVMENLPFEQKFGWKPELQFTSDAEVGYNLAHLKEVK